jgi:hypothetical protein
LRLGLRPGGSAWNVKLLAHDTKIARALSPKSRVHRRFSDQCNHVFAAHGRFDFQQRRQLMFPTGSLALFIDGVNLHATAKALGFDIDYRRLLKEFQGRGTLLRASYYTAVIRGP